VNSLENAKKMIKENNFCVLSTCFDNKPNTSLMKYVSNEEGTEIYMLTLKGSTKYNNIMNNKHVSLLVDTRASGNRGVKALTAYGDAQIVDDEDAERMLKEKLIKINPELSDIAESLEGCIIRVEISSFLMLEGVNESSFTEI
jgi:nitroimidazol reductase NimA-like FMN-containing flavoprotein (pyridoxamine 5'-phosphate oxidase superfamily)